MVIQLIGIRQLSVRRWKNGWSPSRKAALQTQMELRRQQIDWTSPLLAHSPDESHIAKSLLSSSQVALGAFSSRNRLRPRAGCALRRLLPQRRNTQGLANRFFCIERLNKFQAVAVTQPKCGHQQVRLAFRDLIARVRNVG